MTFFVLLAIFPAIAALVSIYGLFADPASLADQVTRLSDILPGGAIEVVGEQMRRVSSQGGTTLGITFLISLAVSLWSANSGMKAMFDALNIVHDEKEKRGFFRLNAISLAFTILGLVLALIAVAAVVLLPILSSSKVPFGTAFFAALARELSWPSARDKFLTTSSLGYFEQ